MKIRGDFVTNSSSTSYVIDVKAKLTAEEFVNDLFNDEGFKGELDGYEWWEDTRESVLESLKQEGTFPLEVGEHTIVWGDEDGTSCGRVFDYCLRSGFSFDIFEVRYKESLR
jgi:hypothetical protein